MNSRMKHSTTIVSCYYPRNENSRHTFEEYNSWIEQFLTYVNTPIVMFSDGEAYDWMYKVREKAQLLDRFFLIRKPLSDLECSSPEWEDIWTRQLKLGPWKDEPFQTIFKIWNQKSFFVEEVLQKNPFESDVFVWCDAGCWRNPIVCRNYAQDWPCLKVIQPNRMFLLVIESMDALIQRLNEPDIQTLEDVVTKVQTCHKTTLSGTMLVGDRKAWEIWIPIFREALQYYAKHNLFAGDDQAVLASTYLWILKSLPAYAPTTILDPIGRGLTVVTEGQLQTDRWYQLQILLSQSFAHNFA
jgi:hypothetical protein